MKKYISFVIGLAILPFFLSAQQSLKNNLRVVVDGDTLYNAWGGGMNAPQFSHIDFDKDGKQDLVVFDREDDSFTPYLNTGSNGYISFTFSPQYEKAFADCNCDDWALAVDYNCDGKSDIFCGSGSYMSVYKQVENNGEIAFELDYFRVQSTFIGGFYLWVFEPPEDIPAITDVDGDGDIDIVNWKFGSDYVEYHRNYAMEDFGRCDTLHLREETGCWGHFTEDDGNQVSLHDTASRGCELGNFSPTQACSNLMRRMGRVRHAGSTTLLLDLNGDEVKDALVSDVSSVNMYALYNCGSKEYAYIDSVDRTFPIYDDPINMYIFPAAFYVDLDDDDVRDLVVATNEVGGTQNVSGTQFYLNKGADNFPDFVFRGQGFLQDENIDQGSGTNPTFFDYNADGLLDLLVGDAGVFDSTTKSSTHHLMLYENVGDVNVPIFELVDPDYLNLGADSLKSFYAPEAGDLDGDGDQDLLVGLANGEILFYENTSSASATAVFSLVDTQFLSLDVGGNAAPLLYDFDTDGDLDLFIGNLRGRITYYENEGTATNYNFKLETEEFGFVQMDDGNGNIFQGNSKPIIADYDQDNVPELLVGDTKGEVKVFENLDQGLTDTLPIGAILLNTDFGSFASPAAAVLDSTGDLTFVIGLGRGGLKLANSLPERLPPSVSIDDQDPAMGIQFFPNPTNRGIRVEMTQEIPGGVQMRIMNIQGQVLKRELLTQAATYISLEEMASGMYLIQFEGNGRMFSKKLVKE